MFGCVLLTIQEKSRLNKVKFIAFPSPCQGLGLSAFCSSILPQSSHHPAASISLLCYNSKNPNSQVKILMNQSPRPVADSHTPSNTLVELLRFRAEQSPDRIAYRFIQDSDSEIVTITYQ